MNTPRYKRGDKHPSNAGLFFIRYPRPNQELWGTEEQLAQFRLHKNSWTRKNSKRPEIKLRNNERSCQYSQAPQRKRYMVKYQRDKRDIYSPRSREWRRQYKQNRRKTDVTFRLRELMSDRMRQSFRYQSAKKNSAATLLLGCSYEFFRGWLEAQFTGKMSWQNYGTLWSVDHIKPICSFDLFNETQAKSAFHYTNCQPLLKSENSSKSDRITVDGQIVRASHHLNKLIPFKAA